MLKMKKCEICSEEVLDGFAVNKVLDYIVEQRIKRFLNHMGIATDIERVKDLKKVML